MIKSKLVRGTIRHGVLTLGFAFVGGQAIWRYVEQIQGKKLQTQTGASLHKSFDLRGLDEVMKIVLTRESDDFKARVRQKQKIISYWPGLRAAQISWVWMQTLSGLHTPSSFENDYSWLFSKLDFLSRATPDRGDIRTLSLAPFFLIIGTDGVGSTLLVREWIQKYPGNWKTWFYAGFHAYDILKAPNLAANYYQRTATFEAAPDYVTALALRLQNQEQIEDKKNRDLLLRDLDPALLQRLKRVRPEWFD